MKNKTSKRPVIEGLEATPRNRRSYNKASIRGTLVHIISREYAEDVAVDDWSSAAPVYTAAYNDVRDQTAPFVRLQTLGIVTGPGHLNDAPIKITIITDTVIFNTGLTDLSTMVGRFGENPLYLTINGIA